jgi:ribosome-associated translation inhibitor RaiA
MITKLDILVDYLIDSSFDQEVINNVIIDNFMEKEATEYEIGNDTYKVISSREKEDELYMASEKVYDELYSTLEMLVARSNMSFENKRILEKLISLIPYDEGIDVVRNSLVFEEELALEEVFCSGDYTVYRYK